MINGKSNKEISQYLSIPLSTIQRRTRHLFESGIIIPRVELDYEKLGYKTGLLDLYLKNGNIDNLAKRINELEGVTSIEFHIGNKRFVPILIHL